VVKLICVLSAAALLPGCSSHETSRAQPTIDKQATEQHAREVAKQDGIEAQRQLEAVARRSANNVQADDASHKAAPHKP
jgi:hypothetical protein